VHTWYRKRARQVFAERLAAVYSKARLLGIPEPELRVRAMAARWGSATGTVITLNTKLVQAPIGCIDYVVCHELAHLAPEAGEAPHGAGFEGVLRRLAPDWQARREELNPFRGA
jgi:predicted metal-dependent hydrolase